MKKVGRQVKKKPDLGDVALEKILNAANPIAEIQHEMTTIKRHMVGVNVATDRLHQHMISLKSNAKCPICYEKYGWLTKCDCKIMVDNQV